MYQKVKYSIGHILKNRRVLSYRNGKYTVECLTCGTKYTSNVNGVSRNNCLCKMNIQTVKLKEKIADILEMFFGLGIQIPEIAKKYNHNSANISYLISQHGFKKQKGITLTLKSKV